MAHEPETESRLQEVILSYLRAVDAGEPPSEQDMLLRHPELGRELADFFADQKQVAPLLRPERSVATRSFGDYELLDEIARGGMGVVYRARQVSLNRVVALKMILGGAAASAVDQRRFRAEADKAAQLDHPNIVPIHEVGEHEGVPFFSMKMIEGGSLAQRFDDVCLPPGAGRSGRARQLRIAGLMAIVARAVHFAHQHGILHRDLKPGNILLAKSPEPRAQSREANGPLALSSQLSALDCPMLTDFGLAKSMAEEMGMTETGVIVGTASYMAPEQASGSGLRLSTAADVYSLGAILYELLTGRPPFHAATSLEILRQVQEQEPVKPSSVNRGVDVDLETICLKCLEKAPERRYASAEALAEDLERWQEGKPTQARPVGRVKRVLRWCRRHPSRVALAVLAAFALLSALSAGHAWELRAENARTAAKLARSVEGQLLLVKHAVLITAQQDRLRQALGRPDDDPRRRRDLENALEETKNDFNKWWSGKKPLVNLFVMTPDGMLLADSFSRSRAGKNYRDRDYCAVFLGADAPTERDALYVSRVFLSQQDGLYKFAVTTRVWDGAHMVGLLSATIPIDARMVAFDLGDEPAGAMVVGPMDWHYTAADAVPRMHPYIAVLHPGYAVPGANPIWVDDDRLPVLATFTQDSAQTRAAEHLTAAGDCVDYVRAGDSPFVVVVVQPYPWPLRGLLRQSVWLGAGVALAVLATALVGVVRRARGATATPVV